MINSLGNSGSTKVDSNRFYSMKDFIEAFLMTLCGLSDMRLLEKKITILLHLLLYTPVKMVKYFKYTSKLIE